MTKTIAVIGSNGHVSKPTIEALTSAPFASEFSLPITVITRDASKATPNDKVKYVEATLDDKAKLTEAFKGLDVVVDTTQAALEKTILVDAIADAGVKLFIPSEFGVEYDLSPYAIVFASKQKVLDQAKAKGVKTVRVLTGLFGEFFETIPFFFSLSDKKLFKADAGDIPATITYLGDIGRAIASIASQDPSAVKSEYHTGHTITQNDVAKILDAQGIKYTVEETTAAAVQKTADETVAAKDLPAGFGKVLKGIWVTKGFNFTNKYDNDELSQGKFSFRKFGDKPLAK